MCRRNVKFAQRLIWIAQRGHSFSSVMHKALHCRSLLQRAVRFAKGHSTVNEKFGSLFVIVDLRRFSPPKLLHHRFLNGPPDFSDTSADVAHLRAVRQGRQRESNVTRTLEAPTSCHLIARQRLFAKSSSIRSPSHLKVVSTLLKRRWKKARSRTACRPTFLL